MKTKSLLVILIAVFSLAVFSSLVGLRASDSESAMEEWLQCHAEDLGNNTYYFDKSVGASAVIGCLDAFEKNHPELEFLYLRKVKEGNRKGYLAGYRKKQRKN